MRPRPLEKQSLKDSVKSEYRVTEGNMGATLHQPIEKMMSFNQDDTLEQEKSHTPSIIDY